MHGTERGDGPASTAPAVFAGRSTEVARLLSAARDASSVHAQLVIVSGSAGIGKSALVAAALARCPDFRLVVIRADESESLVPYCTLGQLAAAWPRRQVHNLALLGGGPPRWAEAVSVGAELVRVLGDPDLGGPLALVVEDAHWLDEASAQALQFAVRRLGAEQALVVVTTRGGRRPVDLAWNRLAEIPGMGQAVSLGPLEAAEVEELARKVRGQILPPAWLRRLYEETGGHPLHVRLVLEQSSRQQQMSKTSPLTAPASLTDTTMTVLATLSGPAQDVIMAVAVLGSSPPVPVVAAVSRAADFPEAVEEAVASGLLHEQRVPEGRHLAFQHPLLAAAIFDGIGENRRRAFHLTASIILPSDAALSHRLAVAEGPDEVLAADLEASASRLEAAGDIGEASARMLGAAQANPRSDAADSRFLRGVGLLVTAGDMVRAAEFAPRVQLCPPGPQRDTVLASLAMNDGRLSEAAQLLSTATHAAQVRGNARTEAAARLLRLVVRVVAGASDVEDADHVVTSPAAPAEWRRQAALLGPLGLGLTGRAEEGLSRLGSAPAPAVLISDEQVPLITARGVLRLWNDDAGALPDLRAVEVSIRQGRPLPGFVPFALAYLGEAEFEYGSWDAAAAAAGVALAVAEGENRPIALCCAHALNARICAERGAWAAAQTSVQACARWATAIPSVQNRFYAITAAAYLARARNDPQSMLAAVDMRATREITFRASALRLLRGEALMGAGRADEADTLTRPLTTASGSIGWRARLVQVEVALARTDLSRARSEMRTLMDTVPASHAFLRGRVELARANLPSPGGDSDDQVALRRAHAIFTQLGARPWQERCQQLLTRRGGESAPVMRAVPLTERERQVAHLVADGMTNAETAERLYVSAKTVEFHLGNIYGKLGISSRRALPRRLAATLSPLGWREA